MWRQEPLDSVQQDEGEQRTAEEQHALSDALSTVTQVTWTTWDALYKLYIQYRVSELLDSVQQDEGEQRTAEEQHALSDAFSTISTLCDTISTISTLCDALSTVTQVPLTAWGTLNISHRTFSITDRFRDTAFYDCWLATDSPWWKKQRFIQAGNLYLWSVSMLKHQRDIITCFFSDSHLLH